MEWFAERSATRFGPMRICTQPMNLRSHSVRYATARSSGTTIATIAAMLVLVS